MFSASPSASRPPQTCTARRNAIIGTSEFFIPHGNASELDETLNIAWEALWQQQGYVQPVSKWRDPIRVSVSGTGAQRHRPFVLAELGRVARSAGIELAEARADGPAANFEVEIVPDDLTRVGFYFACRTLRTPVVGVIQRVKITAEERSLAGCLLHEAMHAMGIPGHPRGGSILSYYRGSSALTANDEFMLKAWYSDEMKPGMPALAALAVADRGAVPAPGARATRGGRGGQWRAAADPVSVVDLDTGRACARPRAGAARARSCVSPGPRRRAQSRRSLQVVQARGAERLACGEGRGGEPRKKPEHEPWGL
jgi:hypothetical protein